MGRWGDAEKNYGERRNKVVIARSAATWQYYKIASLRPVHHAVQGFVRNDNPLNVNLLKLFTIVQQQP
jgi:hypothetical protein